MTDTQIDILMMSGGHGGFENVVNQVSVYLVQNGFHVRYVQLLPSEIDWAAKEVSFICLNLDKNDLHLDDARKAYASLLQKESSLPALVFATGWPYVIYVAKGAVSDSGKNLPVVAWPHGDLHFYEEGGCGDLSFFRFADICFAISNRIALDLYTAYPDKPIYRVRNPFDPSRVHYCEDRNTLKLAYIGRLSYNKAVPIILYALEQTKQPWELLLIGDGEEEVALRTLSAKLRLKKRVLFKGWSENPFSEAIRCRALVMSSPYEGASLTVLEALASGMQLITTPAGNAEELLQDTACGMIVPFGDPVMLAKALDRMAATPFSGNIPGACAALVHDYLPEVVLADFLYKTKACIRLELLPEHFTPDNRKLYASQGEST